MRIPNYFFDNQFTKKTTILLAPLVKELLFNNLIKVLKALKKGKICEIQISSQNIDSWLQTEDDHPDQVQCEVQNDSKIERTQKFYCNSEYQEAKYKILSSSIENEINSIFLTEVHKVMNNNNNFFEINIWKEILARNDYENINLLEGQLNCQNKYYSIHLNNFFTNSHQTSDQQKMIFNYRTTEKIPDCNYFNQDYVNYKPEYLQIAKPNFETVQPLFKPILGTQNIIDDSLITSAPKTTPNSEGIQIQKIIKKIEN